MPIAKLALSTTLAACLLLAPGEALAKRVALVIGNGAYERADALRNPPNDAKALAATLQRSGFEVTQGIDLNHADMVRTIREFASKTLGAELAVFFYAGHGLQVAERNYLLPVNAGLDTEADLDFEAIPLALVVDNMERAAKRRIVFLDACRNNPFARRLARSMGTRGPSVGAGLATVESEVDSLYSFATQPGNVALDGTGDNSPFTTAMLKHLVAPGVEIADALRRVRRDVLDATDGHQVPWDHSSLTEPVYFVSGPQDQAKVDLPRWRGRPPVNACDRLAAHPNDPERMAEGVEMNFIDLAWAIPACAEAARLDPKERRFKFQHARTLHHSRQCERAKVLYEELAAEGHGLALNNIGLLYVAGCGVKRDEAEAVRYYQRAVEAGSAFARFSLGHMYEFGKGIEKNDAEAERLLREAADSGVTQASISLAGKYYAGRGVKRDEAEAVRLVKTAAEAGSIDALGVLGEIHATGRGVAKSPEEAFRYYQLAADRGHPRAYYEIAGLLEKGEGTPKDLAKAAVYYRKAVDAGNLNAMTRLAAMYAKGVGVERSTTEAEKLYQLALESDDGHVIGRIGTVYEHGDGIARNDTEAFRLYRRAVARGRGEYRIRIARMLYTGRGTAKDERAARELFDEILKRGTTREHYDVAKLYERGREAPLKEAEARARLVELAAAGNGLAAIDAARMQMDGRGGARDDEAGAALIVEALRSSKTVDRQSVAAALLTPARPWSPELLSAVKRRMIEAKLYDGPVDDMLGSDFHAAVETLLKGSQRRSEVDRPAPAAPAQ
jgi:TPR repeat protein